MMTLGKCLSSYRNVGTSSPLVGNSNHYPRESMALENSNDAVSRARRKSVL